MTQPNYDLSQRLQAVALNFPNAEQFIEAVKSEVRGVPADELEATLVEMAKALAPFLAS